MAPAAVPTPEERFEDLSDFPFEVDYRAVDTVRRHAWCQLTGAERPTFKRRRPIAPIAARQARDD